MAAPQNRPAAAAGVNRPTSGRETGSERSDRRVFEVPKVRPTSLGLCLRAWHSCADKCTCAAGVARECHSSAESVHVILTLQSETCAKACRNYGIDIPGHILCERLGSTLHIYTLYGGARPFGTNALVATHSKQHGHALYLVETNGVVLRFFATAIGKHRQAAKTELEKLKLSDITCADALPTVAKMFISQRDDQKPHELEMAWLTEASDWKFVPVPAEQVQAAEGAARAQLDDSDMDDD